MKKIDLIVVGAGAAGLIASGRASDLGKNVVLIEKNEKIAKKLLITGKGRCNITNTNSISGFLKHTHPNGKFLKYAFNQFFSKDILELLSKQGLETKVERGGRIFPVTDSAKHVADALHKWLKQNKVKIKLNTKVTKLIIDNETIKGVKIVCNDREEILYANKVIMCTGGKSYPTTGSTGEGLDFAKQAGHKIVQTRPALVPIETKGNITKKLQGLGLKNVNASVWIHNKKHAEEFGEMLFTHFGLSGPIILTLSKIIVDELIKKNEIYISIDLKPALDHNKLDKRLIRDLNENGNKQIVNTFKQWLPSKLIPVFLDLLKIDVTKKCHQISAKERKEIRKLMKDFRLDVSNYRSFKEAIITAGGVSLKEINSKTMESKKIKNLFFAGEIIDLHADTGGYNLQIAYSTAWVAAN